MILEKIVIFFIYLFLKIRFFKVYMLYFWKKKKFQIILKFNEIEINRK